MGKLVIYISVFLFSCQPQQKKSLLLNPTHEEWSKPAPSQFEAKFSTSKGEFVILVERDLAPNGVDRFYNLIRHGYYNNARFHRVVPDFIVQFGLAGDPDVSQTWYTQYIPDDPVRASNKLGTVAYAFKDPNTRSTQIYINMSDNSQLDSAGFSPFGKIITGMDIVKQLYSGYGETSGGGLRRGDQSAILMEGNAYLDSNFPQLDRSFKVEIVNR